MRVGWIGLGIMGGRMATRLAEVIDESLIAYDCNPDARLPKGINAVAAESPADVARRADVIFTMVGTPADVQDLYLGSGALLSSAAPGATFVDMTTSTPELARQITETAVKSNIEALDAPVSGGPDGAASGQLSIMVGGSTAALGRVDPLLRVLGRTIVHHGGPGTGQSAKTANQIAIAGSMLAVCEAFLFAGAEGLNVQALGQTLEAGVAGSDLMRFAWPRLASHDMAPGFRVTHMLKDLDIALAEARAHDIALPGTELVRGLFATFTPDDSITMGTQALILALTKLSMGASSESSNEG